MRKERIGCPNCKGRKPHGLREDRTFNDGAGVAVFFECPSCEMRSPSVKVQRQKGGNNARFEVEVEYAKDHARRLWDTMAMTLAEMDPCDLNDSRSQDIRQAQLACIQVIKSISPRSDRIDMTMQLDYWTADSVLTLLAMTSAHACSAYAQLRRVSALDVAEIMYRAIRERVPSKS